MTTETFSNRLKSRRKAEAFRTRVIKMKGEGEANGGGKPKHHCDQNRKKNLIKAASASDLNLQTGSGRDEGLFRSCLVEASCGASR